MWLTLILATMKIVISVVTAVMMMLKTAQPREIMMKSNLTPLDLKKNELTENQAGADGEILQLIKMK